MEFEWEPSPSRMIYVITQTQEEAEQMLILVTEWADRFNLKVNIDKTEMMSEQNCSILY